MRAEDITHQVIAMELVIAESRGGKKFVGEVVDRLWRHLTS
jgi:hypothetical protein